MSETHIKRDCYIYLHISPENHIYIGQSNRIDPNKRWNNGKNYYHNPHFSNVIKKFGWKNIEHKIICDNLTREEANLIEIQLIKLYKQKPEYIVLNLTDGGLGHSGYNFQESSKMKLSKRMKGRIKINKNGKDKMIPRDQLDKYLSEGWQKGTHLKWTEEQKKLISIRMKNFKHTEECKLRNSEIQKTFMWMTNGQNNIRIKKDLKEDYMKIGYVPGKMKNRKPSLWMNNGEKHKIVYMEDKQFYLNNGWKEGMLNGGNGGANLNKVRMHKGDVKKYVPDSKIDEYISLGFLMGW